MKRNKSEYIVQSVVKALDILESMAESEEELGTSELSAKLSLQKSGVMRVLHTMEQRGYVEKNLETGNYRVGLKAFEMGQAYRHQLGLFQAARPLLRGIARKTDESAYIAVLRGPNVVYLDAILTSKPLRLASRVGSITPAYCTAVGKIQLAYLSAIQLEHFLDKTNLLPMTDKTVIDRNKLRKQLEEIARQGWAADDQEYELGVKCVGVPIWGHNRKVIAGISLSGPISRFSEERVSKELLPMLLEAGKEISHRLGYDVRPPTRELP